MINPFVERQLADKINRPSLDALGDCFDLIYLSLGKTSSNAPEAVVIIIVVIIVDEGNHLAHDRSIIAQPVCFIHSGTGIFLINNMCR